MPIAVIAFDFDPLIHLGDRVLRIETLALAAVALLVIVAAAILAGRTPPDPAIDPDAEPGDHLRRDDLMFIVLGIVPGAAIGGRLGYVLLHWDYYSRHTSAIADPSQGSLELSMGVVVGMLTGAYVARLLDGSTGRWLHVAAVPMLLGLGLGKLAMALGGDGQGAVSNLTWATAYLGAGPWGSLAPAIPAHPSQIYEAITTGVVLLLMLMLLSVGSFRRRDGRAFFVALGLWAAGRCLVALTWRDPVVLGPFGAGQLMALVIVGLALILFLVSVRLSRAIPKPDAMGEPNWADPAIRPPF